MTAKTLMIQGTMSNAGKSLITAGLCRIFASEGYRTAPFKAQNMALNSYITGENLEMGRAQAVQAEAAGVEPSVLMNPVLLKPTSDRGSQIIVNGEVYASMEAKDYHTKKKELIPAVKKAYHTLAEQNDVIVIEGAGSPAEINLRENDFVNMGMAEIADAPVILVGDIDRGGVFAQLYGTVELLEPQERERIRGFVINKFRGDPSILEPGLKILEEKTGIPVLGVVPWTEVHIEDEDSLSGQLETTGEGTVDIAVIRFPRISNFTDFTALSTEEEIGVRYVSSLEELGEPDVIILPGTKSTMADLAWMRQNGLEAKIRQHAQKGTRILGICGGYQMLGQEILDPEGAEGIGSMKAMGLLPMKTVFSSEKTRTKVSGHVRPMEGSYEALGGCEVSGYEIHMGISGPEGPEENAFAEVAGHREGSVRENVMGTYLHGLFDGDEFRHAFAEMLREEKGISSEKETGYEQFKQQQFDKLAECLRQSLDMEEIRRIMGLGE